MGSPREARGPSPEAALEAAVAEAAAGNASCDPGGGVGVDGHLPVYLSGLELRHSLPVSVFFCVAYSLVFVLGVAGNVLVVLVVARTPRMRSPTNLFIANLACADLLVNVLCLPFTLVGNLLSAWVLGWVICKTVPYLQGVSVSASINTLVAISVERCLAICYPLRWQVTPRACRRTVAVIWLFSLTITLPWAVVFGLQPLEKCSAVEVCTELWPSALSGNVYFVLAHLLMCYLCPLALISACYLLIWRRVCRRAPPGERCASAALRAAAAAAATPGAPTPAPAPTGVDLMIHRSKVKVVKMLLLVVVSFALSWLPLYALCARVKFGGPPTSDGEEALIHAALPVAQWLGASNSCVNPVLYTAFNKKFRAAFRAILTTRSCCGPLRYDDSFATSSARSSFHCKVARGVGMGSLGPMGVMGRGRPTPATLHLLQPARSAAAITALAATAPARPRPPPPPPPPPPPLPPPPARPPRRHHSAYALSSDAAPAATALPIARSLHSFVGLSGPSVADRHSNVGIGSMANGVAV